MFFVILGLLGFLVCLVMFVVRNVKRRAKNPFGSGMIFCLALFLTGVMLMPARSENPVHLEPVADVQKEALAASAEGSLAAEGLLPETSETEPVPEVSLQDGSDSAESSAPDSDSEPQEAETDYVLNTNSKKFHTPSCRYAQKISEENRLDFTGARSDLIAQSFSPCGHCNP